MGKMVSGAESASSVPIFDPGELNMADNEMQKKLESLRSGGRGSGSIAPALDLITSMLKN